MEKTSQFRWLGLIWIKTTWQSIFSMSASTACRYKPAKNKYIQIWDEQWSPCRELPHSDTSCIRCPQRTEKHPSKMLNVTEYHFPLEIRAFSWQPTMDRCSGLTVTNTRSVALNTSAHPSPARESPGRNHFLFHDTAPNDRLCSWRLVARVQTSLS